MDLVKLSLVASMGIGSIAYAYSRKHGTAKWQRLMPTLLAGYALAHILLMIFLWTNHIAFPLNLEAMELTVLQHLKRIIEGLPLYPEPTSDFVALAYNPLYYYLCVPFALIFGTNLLAMRLVSILGVLGSALLIFLAVRRETKSNWWGLMATGLYAAAYQAMDTYLDNAHRDSWLMFSILLGCYLIDQNQSRMKDCIGVILTVIAFWFKQQGAIFAIGTVLYLTWRDGWRKSWLFWLLALVLGPGLYLVIPDWLFGSHFHYFTWQVPRQWTELKGEEIKNLLKHVLNFYFILAIPASIATGLALRARHKASIWYFMFPVAVVSGILATVSPGSNNNVFIPMGTWFIITRVLGLKQLIDRYPELHRWGVHLFAIGLAFALFLYNPTSVIVSTQASVAYKDMVSYLNSLDGTVYAPWLGQLPNGYKFYPSVHWVPLEDIIRGPGVDERNHPTTRKFLESVLHPKGKAYILHNYPLKNDILLAFLKKKYVLDTDLKERFKPLQTLPKRYTLAYPRYLYRYVSEK
jgi:4-amino-4-deoxy-L-arabinose transferase-like glycosyltransferase